MLCCWCLFSLCYCILKFLDSNKNLPILNFYLSSAYIVLLFSIQTKNNTSVLYDDLAIVTRSIQYTYAYLHEIMKTVSERRCRMKKKILEIFSITLFTVFQSSMYDLWNVQIFYQFVCIPIFWKISFWQFTLFVSKNSLFYYYSELSVVTFYGNVVSNWIACRFSFIVTTNWNFHSVTWNVQVLWSHIKLNTWQQFTDRTHIILLFFFHLFSSNWDWFPISNNKCFQEQKM